MATKSEEFFHDKWLGMVQTDSDGLVVAKPVLLEAGCANRQTPEIQEKLRGLCAPGLDGPNSRITNLLHFFQQMFDLDEKLFDQASAIPDDVSLYAPEGPQSIRPTLALLRHDQTSLQDAASSPAAQAAARYIALIWDITEVDGESKEHAFGLSLDKPEIVTGAWSYPPAAKFDRLLRNCRVPVGILTNREVIRLVYAPHGESSGHITFRICDMSTVGGRPILDAMVMLLCANQWFGVNTENSLPSLLRRSREYQGTVTTDLAEQVFNGLEKLLKGFQIAADRDKSGLLRDALELDKDHLYRGLLTVMLRMVFILYAEDRGLLPVDHPLYAKQMSLVGLFERLQFDHGNYPDSMNNRFSAWGHVISLSRAIYLGVKHGDFQIPARQGNLFDPHCYSFLEGWTSESAPIISQSARAEVRVPTVDDGTVFALLSSLLIFQGQRLSYRTLDVEQIGSIYEALMGYQVFSCQSPALAIKLKSKKGSPKYWLDIDAVMACSAGLRIKWLKDECGFETQVATKIKVAIDIVEKERPGDRAAVIEALLPLTTGKKGLHQDQLASPGQYVLQPGIERRRSGSQYTPRSLTEPIIRKTLEPLILKLGSEPTANQLLQLKICDPSMGSGAFLVECCRQIADEVVTAWGRSHEIESIAANCHNGDVVAHARRLVAQGCLYGVDKNVMAVQLAKLSLWLFTLSKDLPFTFLDHCLRHGDALIGLSLEQVKSFHWKTDKQLSFLSEDIERAMNEVIAIRGRIHLLINDVSQEGQELKTQLLFDAQDATEKLRQIADVCVGGFFAKSNENERLKEISLRENLVRDWLSGNSEAGLSVSELSKAIRNEHSPFHWWLEFPEVFYQASQVGSDGKLSNSACIDAFVGNPPFLGGLKLSELEGGPAYLEWLKNNYSGSFGNADLCSYFFRRAFDLVGSSGTVGFLATNSISEGATRTTGLKWILQSGGHIYDATVSFAWPGDAVVIVTIVHLVKDINLLIGVNRYLDGLKVNFINSRLNASPEGDDSLALASNADLAFIGTNLFGSGFVLNDGEYEQLVSRANNHVCLFPLLGGHELNTSPTQRHSRYVISFGSMSLDEAQRWPELLELVEQRVKPERFLAKDHGPGRHGKKYWWQHGLRSDPLYESISNLPRCLVTAITSKHSMFTFQPINQIFPHSVFVFALDGFTSFAVMQSRIHEVWARLVSSTLGDGLRYSVKSCFATFPFPQSNPRASIPQVESVAEELYTVRSNYMRDVNKGLTDAYNELKNPDCEDARVIHLRMLHEKMDQAVLDAYGWGEIVVPKFCASDANDKNAIQTFNEAIINRLYLLNTERAEGEKIMHQKTLITNEKSSTKRKSVKNLNMSLPGISDANSNC